MGKRQRSTPRSPGRARKGSKRETLTQARTRKMAADARLAELAVEEKEGRLLPVEDFKRILAAIVDELRARITAFPGKYAPRLVGMKAIAESQAMLEQIGNEFLTALRETGREVRDAEARGTQRTQRRGRGRPRGPAART